LSAKANPLSDNKLERRSRTLARLIIGYVEPVQASFLACKKPNHPSAAADEDKDQNG
jgi:hypothetical protein